jgi:hypothetical protein
MDCGLCDGRIYPSLSFLVSMSAVVLLLFALSFETGQGSGDGGGNNVLRFRG